MLDVDGLTIGEVHRLLFWLGKLNGKLPKSWAKASNATTPNLLRDVEL